MSMRLCSVDVRCHFLWWTLRVSLRSQIPFNWMLVLLRLLCMLTRNTRLLMSGLRSPVVRHCRTSHQRNFSIKNWHFALLELIDDVVVRAIWSKLGILVCIGLQDLLYILLFVAFGLLNTILGLIYNILVVHSLLDLALHL